MGLDKRIALREKKESYEILGQNEAKSGAKMGKWTTIVVLCCAEIRSMCACKPPPQNNEPSNACRVKEFGVKAML